MKRRLNATKSRGGDVFLPMIVSVFADGHNRKSADDSQGKCGDCRLICGGVPVGYKGVVLCFP